MSLWRWEAELVALLGEEAGEVMTMVICLWTGRSLILERYLDLER
jgi:hypothetical protein